MANKIQCFEDLVIWQKAIEFAKDVYVVTEKDGIAKDFGLKNQLRRAAVSISNNIAEGFERRSRKEYLNFLNIAKGSAGESRNLLHIAQEVGYLNAEEHEQLRGQARFLSGSITNHMISIARLGD